MYGLVNAHIPQSIRTDADLTEIERIKICNLFAENKSSVGERDMRGTAG